MVQRVEGVNQALLRLEVAERLVRDQLDRAVAEHRTSTHRRRPPDQWERRVTVERTIAALERAADDLLAALSPETDAPEGPR